MSLWEFTAAVQGWSRANGGGETKPDSLTEDEHDRLMKRYS